MAGASRPTREHILAEIQRCAAENEGVPLGRKRFEAATGIRESDWTGRYWARWNDAVAEAGFTPNVIQGQVYNESELTLRLALVIRELGHFPTAPELRMRRRADPTFPNDKVFSRWLGPRSEQVARLVEFTATHPGYEDVHGICLPLVPDPDPDDEAQAGTPSRFVYLVRSGKNHKIGRSNSVGRRSYEIALQLPEKLELVHAFETDDPAGIERYWHDRFADKRLNGEWFALTKADVAAFKLRRRFM